MKRKIFLAIGLGLCIATVGCSADSETKEKVITAEPTMAEETPTEVPPTEQANNEKETAKPDYLYADLLFDGKECTIPDMMASPEKYTYANEALRITQEQKEAFIEKYGEEEYEGAVSALSTIFHIQSNAPVSPAYTGELKETYTMEDVVLTSKLDGHHITADYILQSGAKDNDTVIMVHGIGGTRRSMREDVFFYLSLGYNVLTYDQRSSGENDGFLYTFGAWEQYDLMECVNYIDQQISSDKKIIVLGQSSGGTSAGLLLANKEAAEKVDYVIFDSPVTSVYELIQSKLYNYVKREQVENALKSCEDFMNFMYGFGFEDVEVANFVADTTIPVLIFTSKVDGVVPLEQPKHMYDTIKSDNKKIVISEISSHCAMNRMEHELYEREVRDFLGK